MKKFTIIAIVFVSILFAAGMGTHFIMLDGLDGFIWSRMLHDDTRYSERYSDAAFREVRVGMTESEVTRLLGAPLRAYTPDRSRDWTSLWFSESPTDSNFRRRTVELRDGKVIGKQSEFYVD